ncbi:amino acid ABC transporter substrate-binding protein [Streptococcus tangpeifui]|uniref:amino acid ABC transporter substrate-binding protein n=1 Tax=Streptococcus tangpeifui TaxID=2709400 RepID=UPI0013EC1827|nr:MULTISPECIES: amino acid ABC transporter substrate-binding protein [unclassified Streptococcus]
MKLKNIVKLGAVAVASVAILAACSSKGASGGKETVNFATVGTTAPFSYEDKNGNLTGYDIEVAKAVFKGSDKYKVEFKKTEWSSVFAGLDSGKYQMGGNNISYSTDRAKKYLYSEPTGTTPTVLTVPKDSDIKSYDDIAGHSTQVVQGTTTAKQLEDYNKKHSDNPVDINYTEEDVTQILGSLNDGKFDFKLFDAPTVNSVIKSQNLSNLKTIDVPSEQKPFIYFVFSSDQKDLQSYVNKRLEKLQKDGTLAKLAEKHLGNKDYIPTAKEMKVPAKK